MTQKEKKLLLKDLCARLPYGVKTSSGHGTLKLSPRTDVTYVVDNGHIPYLRPMSSMTKEEEKEVGNYVAAIMFASQNKDPLFQLTREAFLGDFFNKHHFDYRDLIPMGLALEAPEGMYKTK